MMGNKIYDAHVHLDMREKNPYAKLRKELRKNEIEKCVLVLNTVEEEEVFWECRKIIENDKIISAVAAILDIKNNETFRFMTKAKQEKLNVIIKIHPRLTRIRREDFESIYKAIQEIGLKVILIDDFIYGPELECQIGTELAIYLARKIPETKIILAHAGGCDTLKTLLLTRPLENIYYDYSLTCNYLETTSVRQDLINGLKYTNSRIMFGTDFPDFSFEDSIRVVKKLCLAADIDKREEEAVFYYNALKIYGGELNNV